MLDADNDDCEKILEDIDGSNTTLLRVLLIILRSPELSEHRAASDLLYHVQDLLESLYNHPAAQKAVLAWMQDKMTKAYMAEVQELASKKGGLQFNAVTSIEDQIEQFDVERIDIHLNTRAPLLSALLGELLSADRAAVKRRKAKRRRRKRGQEKTAPGRHSQAPAQPVQEAAPAQRGGECSTAAPTSTRDGLSNVRRDIRPSAGGDNRTRARDVDSWSDVEMGGRSDDELWAPFNEFEEDSDAELRFYRHWSKHGEFWWAVLWSR
ncbi:hypothetical protein DAEQUDRAFT_64361 [Daedalea quercina L-15889]|uniref:Uncharacterized protein n=1 Tax=Daedalea quercina L-15889 TaxID=1314783 RepID=A0A165PR44_9APHY|nr:hypothetical protein DAEQUDRAFT_330529 [Daedalea quercina L-15889]KZT72242.1 hypothetical protein DAEQUDRAFT_64361 [Daedalea quercina L-15889]